jgi:hypothetical protein
MPYCAFSHTQLEEEKREYEEAIKLGPKIPAGTEPDLGMRVLLVHGDEVRMYCTVWLTWGCVYWFCPWG